MRFVIAGAGHVAEILARRLAEENHEIVVIDESRDRLDELAKSVDASFLCGNATSATILNEADPARTDVLFCVTDLDQTNILTALLGRHLGYQRAIPSIRDPGLSSLCDDLGFEDFVTPAETVAEKLAALGQRK